MSKQDQIQIRQIPYLRLFSQILSDQTVLTSCGTNLPFSEQMSQWYQLSRTYNLESSLNEFEPRQLYRWNNVLMNLYLNFVLNCWTSMNMGKKIHDATTTSDG